MIQKGVFWLLIAGFALWAVGGSYWLWGVADDLRVVWRGDAGAAVISSFQFFGLWLGGVIALGFACVISRPQI